MLFNRNSGQRRHFCFNRTGNKGQNKTTRKQNCRQIQDLCANFGIKERRKHRGRSRSCSVALLSFYPKGWNRAYFCSTGSGFRDIGRFFNIAIFEHKTWPLAKVPKLHIHTLFLPKGFKIELIFAQWATVSDILTDFQNCHIWAWNLAIDESSRIKLTFALRAAVFEIEHI